MQYTTAISRSSYPSCWQEYEARLIGQTPRQRPPQRPFLQELLARLSYSLPSVGQDLSWTPDGALEHLIMFSNEIAATFWLMNQDEKQCLYLSPLQDILQDLNSSQIQDLVLQLLRREVKSHSHTDGLHKKEIAFVENIHSAESATLKLQPYVTLEIATALLSLHVVMDVNVECWSLYVRLCAEFGANQILEVLRTANFTTSSDSVGAKIDRCSVPPPCLEYFKVIKKQFSMLIQPSMQVCFDKNPQEFTAIAEAICFISTGHKKRYVHLGSLFLLALLNPINKRFMQQNPEAKGQVIGILHEVFGKDIQHRFKADQEQWLQLFFYDTVYMEIFAKELNVAFHSLSQTRALVASVLDMAILLKKKCIATKNQEVFLKKIRGFLTCFLKRLINSNPIGDSSECYLRDALDRSNTSLVYPEVSASWEYLKADRRVARLSIVLDILYEEIKLRPRSACWFRVPAVFDMYWGLYRENPFLILEDRSLCLSFPQITIFFMQRYLREPRKIEFSTNLDESSVAVSEKELSSASLDRVDSALIKSTLADLMRQVERSQLEQHSAYYWEAFVLIVVADADCPLPPKSVQESLTLLKLPKRDFVTDCLDQWLDKAPRALLNIFDGNLLREQELIYLCTRLVEISKNTESKTPSSSSLAKLFLNKFFYLGKTVFLRLYYLNFVQLLLSDVLEADTHHHMADILEEVEAQLSVVEDMWVGCDAKQISIFFQEIINLHQDVKSKKWLQGRFLEITRQFGSSSLFAVRLKMFLKVILKTFLWRHQNKNREFYTFIGHLCLARYPLYQICHLLDLATQIDVPWMGIEESGSKRFVHAYLLGLNYHRYLQSTQMTLVNHQHWLCFVHYTSFKGQLAHRSMVFLLFQLLMLPEDVFELLHEKIHAFCQAQNDMTKAVSEVIPRLKLVLATMSSVFFECNDPFDQSLFLKSGIQSLSLDTCFEVIEWSSQLVDQKISTRELYSFLERDPDFFGNFLLYYALRSDLATKELLAHLLPMMSCGDSEVWNIWRHQKSPFARSIHAQTIQREYPLLWEQWMREKVFTLKSRSLEKVLFTSSPSYLLSMGSFVTGSCLDFASGFREENDVLASILADPKQKLFVLLNASGDPVARVMATLLFTSSERLSFKTSWEDSWGGANPICMEPVMVLHRFFPKANPENCKQHDNNQRLLEAVILQAKEMGATCFLTPFSLSDVVGVPMTEEEGEVCLTQFSDIRSCSEVPVAAPSQQMVDTEDVSDIFDRLGVVQSPFLDCFGQSTGALCLEGATLQDLLPGADFAIDSLGSSFEVKRCFRYKLHT